MTTISPTPYLFMDEAAAYLRIPLDTCYRWARDGRIPAVKVGRKWRIARADLDAMLAGTA
ncbi:MAG TPA: helix-turn-helix domain-containing protein [Mycobacterium sp.]|nr:helix-turn-helix domain-containing protein [Mycobacterium sp.]